MHFRHSMLTLGKPFGDLWIIHRACRLFSTYYFSKKAHLIKEKRVSSMVLISRLHPKSCA